jgi:hypothetical protein
MASGSPRSAVTPEFFERLARRDPSNVIVAIRLFETLMQPIDPVRTAGEIMAAFISRTGVSPLRAQGERYLWTDAFAVLNCLSLYRHTGSDKYLEWAIQLVQLVHAVLGRHRDDAPRTGWISGLSEAEGNLHPTAGGLRIGKTLPERRPDEAYDESAEWDRDGQYFHYLTKWMHALDRMAQVTGDAGYNVWGLELAEAAHHAFVRHRSDGEDAEAFMHWKMSVDLSRPLVASMGALDPLDGLVSCARLEATRRLLKSSRGPDLSAVRADFHRMCKGRKWTTEDELGIGGLLAEALQLIQLIEIGSLDHTTVLDDLVEGAVDSLHLVVRRRRFDLPASYRLPFRELGLAIGLQAAPLMLASILRRPDRFPHREILLRRIDSIAGYSPLIESIERFWMKPSNQSAVTWTGHLNIKAVMLASSLLPDAYLTGSSTQAHTATWTP